jgi:hypothetical protein
MSYRDDDDAADARARALIDEIARLERARLSHAAEERRLEEARRELTALQPSPAPQTPRAPGLGAHLVVFSVAACATFAAYSLLW